MIYHRRIRAWKKQGMGKKEEKGKMGVMSKSLWQTTEDNRSMVLLQSSTRRIGLSGSHWNFWPITSLLGNMLIFAMESYTRSYKLKSFGDMSLISWLSLYQERFCFSQLQKLWQTTLERQQWKRTEFIPHFIAGGVHDMMLSVLAANHIAQVLMLVLILTGLDLLCLL